MKQDNDGDSRVRIGVSTCLLGMNVRYDGGHKRDRFITDMLSQYFEFVHICPEVEIGMGVPREAVHLEGDTEKPRMITRKSGRDWTDKMNRYSAQKARQLPHYRLSGYIFKSRSPSCGIERVKLYALSGQVTNMRTAGLYARQVVWRCPMLPVEDEGRLNDAKLRENFIVRVFAYHRLQQTFPARFKRADVVNFHTAHKYLMLAHSPKHYKQLGQLVAAIKQFAPGDFRDRYSRLFMEGLGLKSTSRKNVNVLFHMVGFLKNHLDPSDRKYLLQVIDDYHRELVPLVVPITLIRNYVRKFDIQYLADQVYLYPHPKELMLLNHV